MQPEFLCFRHLLKPMSIAKELLVSDKKGSELRNIFCINCGKRFCSIPSLEITPVAPRPNPTQVNNNCCTSFRTLNSKVTWLKNATLGNQWKTVAEPFAVMVAYNFSYCQNIGHFFTIWIWIIGSFLCRHSVALSCTGVKTVYLFTWMNEKYTV